MNERPVQSELVVHVDGNITTMRSNYLTPHQRRSVQNIIIPSNVKTIMEGAMCGCPNLVEVTLSEGVENIGSNAFGKCYSLKHITIPSTVEFLEEGTFCESSLQSITLSDGLIEIGTRAFRYCETLASITIPATVRLIQDEAFIYLSKLEVVTLCGGHTNIDEQAFFGCTGLMELIIEPITHVEEEDNSKGTYIGNHAFSECLSLEKVVLGHGICNIHHNAFYGCTSLRTLIFPASLRIISENAFTELENLMEVELPEGLLLIGKYAFSQCSSLEKVTIPSTLSVISRGAFAGCKVLSEVILREGLIRINKSAFRGCKSLRAIEIPSSIRHIEGEAFYGCSPSFVMNFCQSE